MTQIRRANPNDRHKEPITPGAIRYGPNHFERGILCRSGRHDDWKVLRQEWACRPCWHERQTAWKRENRAKVLAAYGGACACCGEKEPAFLTIDHIAGNGRSQYLQLNGSHRMARWLVQQGYPDGFQLLCWNCNSAKHWLGLCPHQTERNTP